MKDIIIFGEYKITWAQYIGDKLHNYDQNRKPVHLKLGILMTDIDGNQWPSCLCVGHGSWIKYLFPLNLELVDH